LHTGLSALKHATILLLLVIFMASKLLNFVARAANGEPLVIEKLTDAPDHDHFMVLVIATVATPFHRAKLGKFLLPVTKHMGLYAAQFPDFTNGEIALGRDGSRSLIH
jgi:hypothetical protein